MTTNVQETKCQRSAEESPCWSADMCFSNSKKSTQLNVIHRDYSKIINLKE